MKKTVLSVIILCFITLLSSCSQVSQGEYPDLENMKTVEMSQQEMTDYINDITFDESSIQSVKMNMDVDYAYSSTEFVGDIWSGNYDTVSVDHSISGQLEAMAAIKLDEKDNMVEEMNVSVDFELNMKERKQGETQNIDYEAQLNTYLVDEILYINTDFLTSIDGVNTKVDSKQKILDVPIKIDEILAIDDIEITSDMFEDMDTVTMYQNGSVDYIEFSINKEIFYDLDLTSVYSLASIADLDRFLQEDIDEFEMTYVMAIKDNVMIQNGLKVNMALSDENNSYINILVVADMVDEMPDFPDDLDSYTRIDGIEDILGSFI